MSLESESTEELVRRKKYIASWRDLWYRDDPSEVARLNKLIAKIDGILLCRKVVEQNAYEDMVMVQSLSGLDSFR